MTIAVAGHEFDHVTYDAQGDVLYLRAGEPRPATETFGTPEGHAIRLDEYGDVIGITIVNARWLLDRDGKVTITLPSKIETTAEDLGPALASGG